MVTISLLKPISELSIIWANWLSANDSDLQQQQGEGAMGTKIDSSVR